MLRIVSVASRHVISASHRPLASLSFKDRARPLPGSCPIELKLKFKVCFDSLYSWTQLH